MNYRRLTLFVLGLSMGTASARALAADISGTWTISVHLPDEEKHPRPHSPTT
jgi:hypothetical protein